MHIGAGEFGRWCPLVAILPGGEYLYISLVFPIVAGQNDVTNGGNGGGFLNCFYRGYVVGDYFTVTYPLPYTHPICKGLWHMSYFYFCLVFIGLMVYPPYIGLS